MAFESGTVGWLIEQLQKFDVSLTVMVPTNDWGGMGTASSVALQTVYLGQPAAVCIE